MEKHWKILQKNSRYNGKAQGFFRRCHATANAGWSDRAEMGKEGRKKKIGLCRRFSWTEKNKCLYSAVLLSSGVI